MLSEIISVLWGTTKLCVDFILRWSRNMHWPSLFGTDGNKFRIGAVHILISCDFSHSIPLYFMQKMLSCYATVEFSKSQPISDYNVLY